MALRGHGGAEPNPLVGCVLVNDSGVTVGWGYHRTFGGPHAEIEALARAGSAANGATCYVTLEPCNHTGKTGPCAQALIDAGVKHVVIGRRDTTEHGCGGAEHLRTAGVDIRFVEDDRFVRSVSDPFFHRLENDRPWVIAKWAQTLDGMIASRTGDSQWISSLRSRAMVHRQRGRVDVMLTGIGTVQHDDPMLTARCGRVRRVARRVVIDPNLEISPDSKLVRTAGDTPVTVFCSQKSLSDRASKAHKLEAHNVEVIACSIGDEVDLDRVLQLLVERYDAATVLVESGPGLMGRLVAQSLVNEAWVFVGPLLFGDEQAVSAARGRTVQQLTDGIALDLIDQRRRGDDVMLRYRVR